MANKKFSAFNTTGPTSGQFVVGYGNTAAGGERRWTLHQISGLMGGGFPGVHMLQGGTGVPLGSGTVGASGIDLYRLTGAGGITVTEADVGGYVTIDGSVDAGITTAYSAGGSFSLISGMGIASVESGLYLLGLSEGASSTIDLTRSVAGGVITLDAKNLAPDDAEYLTFTSDSDLANAKVLTKGNAIAFTDGGTTLTIDSSAVAGVHLLQGGTGVPLGSGIVTASGIDLYRLTGANGITVSQADDIGGYITIDGAAAGGGGWMAGVHLLQGGTGIPIGSGTVGASGIDLYRITGANGITVSEPDDIGGYITIDGGGGGGGWMAGVHLLQGGTGIPIGSGTVGASGIDLYRLTGAGTVSVSAADDIGGYITISSTAASLPAHTGLFAPSNPGYNNNIYYTGTGSAIGGMGYVGISDKTPAYHLSVSGTGYFSSGLLCGTGDTTGFFVSRSGIVGIGFSGPGKQPQLDRTSGMLQVSGHPAYNRAATFFGDVHVEGTFTASIGKGFLINHPTQPGNTLRYGNLEGPEYGAYERGTLVETDTITLPEYWPQLVDQSTVSVQLTPHGSPQNLYVKSIGEREIVIGAAFEEPINCHYIVHGERHDVPQIILVEPK